MKNHHVHHLLQNSILVVIFLVTIPLLFIFTDSFTKVTIIFLLSLLYVVVGVWHHKEEKKLNRTIFLEYLAVSILIFVVLYSIFR